MIIFKCKSCKYEVSAPEDQAGQMTICPSCYTELWIPPPNTDEKIKEAEKAENIFEIHKSGIFKVYDANIPVYCKLCHTLMYAKEEQAGQELTCPDCGTKTVVRVYS